MEKYIYFCARLYWRDKGSLGKSENGGAEPALKLEK